MVGAGGWVKVTPAPTAGRETTSNLTRRHHPGVFSQTVSKIAKKKNPPSRKWKTPGPLLLSLLPCKNSTLGGEFKSQIWAETIPKLSPTLLPFSGLLCQAESICFHCLPYRVTWVCVSAQKGSEGGQRERERENSGRFSGNGKFFFTEIEITWQPAVKSFWVPEESRAGEGGGKKASKEREDANELQRREKIKLERKGKQTNGK